MCGFAGILAPASPADPQGAEALRAVAIRMAETLRARGPDAGGAWSEGPVALGHRRLAIIDLSEAGAQPMQLRPGGAVIAYNGEVYNFAELRAELEAQGHAFRGHSDTEVVLRAYEAWGEKGLRRLEGIFAFGLWDPAAGRLLLMRDRLGIKPLYYGDGAAGLAFGSEIKAVLAAGGIDTRLDDQAFAEYLWFGNVHGERTFHRGVRAVPPGHVLVVEPGGSPELRAWWRIEEWLERDGRSASRDAATEALREAIDASVRRQLVADVPVGLFLSGGIDSSTIACAAMRVQAEPLRSFSAGFDFERGVDELPQAARLAGQLGLQHRELRVAGADLPATLRTLAKAHDEPFADAANVPLFLMCRALGGEVKVVLQGDGGDELFAGYRRYGLLRHVRAARLWPRVLSPMLAGLGGSARRLARMAEALGHADPALRMASLLTVERLADPPEALLQPDRAAALGRDTDPFLAYREAAARFAGHEPVQQMLLTDLTVQLPSQFLPKVDRATMVAGVEARVPLLDERVAALAVGWPSAWKVGSSGRKLILRDSQRGRVPDAVLDGPKTGFGVPFEHWMRGPLHEFARERLLDRSTLEAFGLRRDVVEATLAEHREGRRERGFRLWKLLQLALWRETRA